MSFAEDAILPGPGDVLAGKYRVDGVVGRGGMGVVLSAQHIQLKQQVALKLLLVPGLDEVKRTEAAARFVKEGQAAAQLTSDHVVRIFDVGTLEDGAPFMVMELLRGDDLSTVIRQSGAVPTELALEYLAQACDAIGEAHALGIVHRDLKPSNLFLCRRNDGRPLVKVLDFGISKMLRPEQEAVEGDLTATRAVVGSPLYMSPEQLRDAKRVDPRTDVWSLGMVLYELITGGPAFQSTSLLGLTAAIAADAPVPPRVCRPEIPEELDAIILRCLEKDPAKRFQSVAGLLEAITPLLPRGPAQSGAEYTSKRLESLLEAAAGRAAFRDRPTFRGSELEVPRSEDSWGVGTAGPGEGVAGDNWRTAVTSSDYSRAPSEPPIHPAPVTLGSAPARTLESGPRLAADGSSTLVSSTGSAMQPDTAEGETVPPIEEAAPSRRGRLLLLALLTLIALAVVTSLLSSPEGKPEGAPTASAQVPPVPPRASATSVAAPPEAPAPVESAEPKGEPSAASSSFPPARKTAPRKTVPAQPRPADPVDINLER